MSGEQSSAVADSALRPGQSCLLRYRYEPASFRREPSRCADTVYGIQLANVRLDALPMRYDHDGWMRSFLLTWPPRSPAHHAYFQRIARGPDFEIADAIGGNVQRYVG